MPLLVLKATTFLSQVSLMATGLPSRGSLPYSVFRILELVDVDAIRFLSLLLEEIPVSGGWICFETL